MLKDRMRYLKHKAWTYIFLEKVQYRLANKIHVLFTFDTEEDWDNNNPLYYHSMVYYDSYKYIFSGIFYKLVKGLNERSVTATFYVTYNVASVMPEVLEYLERKNQRIGVHVHPHNFQNVAYPYATGKRGDRITSYSFAEKIKWMKTVKDQIEPAVGHQILLYRSGQLACDNQTEKAARSVGFQAISNCSGVYCIKPLSIWNLGVGEEDLFDFGRFGNLSKYIEHFKKRAKKEQIIVFSAHPMLLYNHATDKTREEELNTFFDFVDYLKVNENVEIINQYQLLEILEDWRYK